MIGVILAAGDGTRLAKSTGQDICKALRNINGKHLLEYSLENLISLGINKAYIAIGKQGDLIKDAFGSEYKSLSLHYVSQKEQKGLMNAFVEALSVIDCNETVVLQLSDEIFIDLNANDIENMVKNEKADFYCGVTPEENVEKIKNNFSVESDENSLMIKCTEKPKIVTNNIKGTGFSIFSNTAVEIIKEKSTQFVDLCDSFNFFVSAGYKGLVFNVAKREFNINTVEDLNEAEKYLNK